MEYLDMLEELRETGVYICITSGSDNMWICISRSDKGSLTISSETLEELIGLLYAEYMHE